MYKIIWDYESMIYYSTCINNKTFWEFKSYLYAVSYYEIKKLKKKT
jgi:hypothetical protein